MPKLVDSCNFRIVQVVKNLYPLADVKRRSIGAQVTGEPDGYTVRRREFDDRCVTPAGIVEADDCAVGVLPAWIRFCSPDGRC